MWWVSRPGNTVAAAAAAAVLLQLFYSARRLFFFDARMIASKLRLLVVCCCSYFPGFFAINRDLDYIPREPAGDHAIYQNCCLQFVVRFVLCRLRKAEITWCFPGKHVYACFNESLMGVNTNSY